MARSLGRGSMGRLEALGAVSGAAAAAAAAATEGARMNLQASLPHSTA